MYTEFFGLNEKPFSISPDPRYLYLSRRHADALAHLIYGISESGGFIQLTGEVGTGKTTLIRSLLEQLPDKSEIALILNPQLSRQEFLESICEELGIPLPEERSTKALVDSLNAQLLRANAQDRRIVLIVDEAQTLSPELLEQVRLLTNLETVKKKLLQIILIGQPELREILDRPEMRQIAQRITGRYHLEPLSSQETVVYVKHRMRVAGAHREIFKSSAMRRIFKESRGIPRLINIVADRALLAAYTEERSTIDGPLVRRAAREVFGGRVARRWWFWAAAAAVLVGLGLAVTLELGVEAPDAGGVADAEGSALLGTNAATSADPDAARPEREAAQNARAVPDATPRDPAASGASEGALAGAGADTVLAAAARAATETAAAPNGAGTGTTGPESAAGIGAPAAEAGTASAETGAAPGRLEADALGTDPPNGDAALGVEHDAQFGAPSAQADGAPVVSLAALLADESFATDSVSAARALFGLWQSSYEPNRGTACSQAVEQNLQCLFSSRGSIGELRRLNRPSVVTLVDNAGERHQIVVSRLDYDTAEILAGARRERVPVLDLTHLWYGEGWLLWRPIFPDAQDLAPGTRSENVPWLRDSLQRILGTTITSVDPLVYDETLIAHVREFQKRERLTVDGVVGAQTQIALQTALRAPDVPMLAEVN